MGTDLPSQKIAGEKICEVPQHWKSQAVQGLDTRKPIATGTIAQFEMAPELVGDALGMFVEGMDPTQRDYDHYPRFTWPILFVSVTGEQRMYSAVSKNPLRSRYLTAIIPDMRRSEVAAGHLYLLSGAMTKIFTAQGAGLPLPIGVDCLKGINAEFIRNFPSKPERLADAWAYPEITDRIRQDFPRTSFPGDGNTYALAETAWNPKFTGSLRQVTDDERSAERGHQVVVFPPGWATIASYFGGKIMATLNQVHTGPFGERAYSAYEAGEALRNRLVQYHRAFEALEKQLGVKNDPPDFVLALSGKKSGWEIGQELAPTVRESWERYEALERALE
ncbi:MAG: hypothetical protein Q8Q10_01355, partial [bacterium]|nr:hypothetical protein [bacterium]